MEFLGRTDRTTMPGWADRPPPKWTQRAWTVDAGHVAMGADLVAHRCRLWEAEEDESATVRALAPLGLLYPSPQAAYEATLKWVRWLADNHPEVVMRRPGLRRLVRPGGAPAGYTEEYRAVRTEVEGVPDRLEVVVRTWVEARGVVPEGVDKVVEHEGVRHTVTVTVERELVPWTPVWDGKPGLQLIRPLEVRLPWGVEPKMHAERAED